MPSDGEPCRWLGPAKTASKSANGTSATLKRSDSWLFSDVKVSTKYVADLTPHLVGLAALALAAAVARVVLAASVSCLGFGES